MASDQMEAFEELFGQGSRTLDEKLMEWERRHSHKEHGAYREKEESFTAQSAEFRSRGTASDPQYPQEVVDDLQLFGLAPPSSLKEVKKVRNEEIKIYHPDRYHSDSAKRETAKRILQIYNSAYERLRRYYRDRSN